MVCWCWLWELLEGPWFILLLAIAGALLVLWHFHAGCCLMESCGFYVEPLDPCEVTCDITTRATGFDYGMRHGPHTWRTADEDQSPINIDTLATEQSCFTEPLLWMGYEELPLGIRLENNGHTLLLRAAYAGAPPSLGGGDLLGCMRLNEISFRWSWCSGAGSEHTLDNQHYPLEMQCLHTDSCCPGRASSNSLLVISYVFSVAEENPFLDVVIQHLVAVQQAGQCVEVPPFPLNYLMPPFRTGFYSYQGSLTEPPCHRGAEWFIYPLPISIGERQLHEFRKLRSRSGARILRNARPVQPLGDRLVYFNHLSPP